MGKMLLHVQVSLNTAKKDSFVNPSRNVDFRGSSP